MTHFQILVEDSSGEALLEHIVPKIIGESNSYEIKHYKGIGRIPTGLKPGSDPKKRILLDQLPRLVSGYGSVLSRYPETYPAVLVIVCDLDRRCLKEFRDSIMECIHRCINRPETILCLAVEEGESWLLGDTEAVVSAYPRARTEILDSYIPDSICGAWEVLANAVHAGGSKELMALGYQAVGCKKHEWANAIGPLIDLDRNKSPSFKYFVEKLESRVTSSSEAAQQPDAEDGSD
jgi:hypothetical protein